MNKRKIIALSLSVLIIVLVVVGVVYTKDSAAKASREAVALNRSGLDEIAGASATELARGNDSECNRFKWYTKKYCEETETRIYSVEDVEAFESDVSEKLEDHGWRGDFEDKSKEYFFSFGDIKTVLISQAEASRNINDGIQNNVSFVVRKTPPSDNNGYFQDTRLLYSDELMQKFENAVDDGKVIVTVTSVGTFETWF
jgi:hypothetical protein